MLSPPGTTVVNGTPTQDTEHYSISANFWSTSDMDLLVRCSRFLPPSLSLSAPARRWA